MSPFLKLLTWFFSRNTLHSVCSAVGDITPVTVASDDAKCDSDSHYRPPLPSISTKPLSTFIQVRAKPNPARTRVTAGHAWCCVFQVNSDPVAVRKVFGLEVGFFWPTFDTDEQVHDVSESSPPASLGFDTQVTMSLIYKRIYRDPAATMDVLSRALTEGLDLCAVRLLYPTAELLSQAGQTSLLKNQPQATATDQKGCSGGTDMVTLNSIGPVLALALRGTFARSVWLDVVGPADPQLARKTDPRSLSARYGGESRDECLIFCPRHPSRVHSELCRWFGGRVPSSGVINTNDARYVSKLQPQTPKKSRQSASAREDNLLHFPPPSCLVAVSRSDVFVVVSPLVPTRCLGLVLATCQKRGYQMRGIRRTRLTARKASSIGLLS